MPTPRPEQVINIAWTVLDQTDFYIDKWLDSDEVPEHSDWLLPPLKVGSVHAHIGQLIGRKTDAVQHRVSYGSKEGRPWFETGQIKDEFDILAGSKLRCLKPAIEYVLEEVRFEQADPIRFQAVETAERAEACLYLARFHGDDEKIETLLNCPVNFSDLDTPGLIFHSERISNMFKELVDGTGLRAA